MKKISNENKNTTKFTLKDIQAFFLQEASEDISREVLSTIKSIPFNRFSIPLNAYRCDIFGTEDDIIEKEIEDKDDKILLTEEINKLDNRDREIIELRYGLSGKKELTQKEFDELIENFELNSRTVLIYGVYDKNVISNYLKRKQ